MRDYVCVNLCICVNMCRYACSMYVTVLRTLISFRSNGNLKFSAVVKTTAILKLRFKSLKCGKLTFATNIRNKILNRSTARSLSILLTTSNKTTNVQTHINLVRFHVTTVATKKT
jgi:hypothetical protein